MSQNEPDPSQSVAIIGMAGRFPGASSVAQLWKNLVDGHDAIATLSDEECLAAGVSPEVLKDSLCVKRAGVLPAIDMFDAAFFGYSPHEAILIDPQQRLFLECAWEALEDSGYVPGAIKGEVSVFGGSGMNTYFTKNILSHRGDYENVVDLLTFIGNDKDYLCSRVAYKFGFQGPAITVQTACSTSLVAVQMGFQSLVSMQCDMALCGGVSLQNPRARAYIYKDGEIFSRDGSCRTFDKDASGIVFGEGCGIVVIKRLEDALADRDHIYAVIRSAVVNNDGLAKAGYTAPSAEAQGKCIAMAHAMAGVAADEISYLEAHGTGTKLGDAIEISGLTQAFRSGTERCGYCGIGSIKTNIGHLDTAAGVAGLIKTALALKYATIPATLHFKEPNPELKLDQSPFRVVKETCRWETGGSPRIAGVSSFGMGGTNAHVVLQEASVQAPRAADRQWYLMPYSARSPKAVDLISARLAEHIGASKNLALVDAEFTLQCGRKALRHRRYAVCSNLEDLSSRLGKEIDVLAGRGEAVWADRKPAFMFSGQGNQYPGMCQGIYQTEPVFREYCDSARTIMKEMAGIDLFDYLFPDTDKKSAAAEQGIVQTQIAQPALFAVEYAMARVLMLYGITPSAFIGHSIGEYVAAAMSGVFSFEKGLQIVIKRSALMQAMPAGAMVSLEMPEDQIHEFLGPDLTVALCNAPAMCVVSGPVEAISVLENKMKSRNVVCRRLRTSHAFHSPMMDDAANELERELSSTQFSEPLLPFISNLRGTWADPVEVRTAAYWSKQMRNTVRFSSGMATILDQNRFICIEVGPGNSLCSLLQLQPMASQGPMPIATIRSSKEPIDDTAGFLRSLGNFWVTGGQVDWSVFHKNGLARRTPLPTYPFEHSSYWIGHADLSEGTISNATAASIVQEALSVNGISSSKQIKSRRVKKGHTEVCFSEASVVKKIDSMNEEVLQGKLVSIWRAVLGREVHISDNFFEAGGHSALAAELFARMHSELGINLPISALFTSPTIMKLVQVIKGHGATQTFSPVVKINEGNGVLPLFLVHGAEGNVLLYRQVIKYLSPEQTVYGLQARGLDGTGEFLTRIEDMAELYVNEIKKIKPNGPYAIGGYCMGGMVALAMAQLFRTQGDEVPFLGMIESYNVRGYGYTPDKFKDIISGIQNIYYHISNTYHAGANRNEFIRDKYVTETKRIEFKLRLISGRIQSLWNSSKVIEFPHFQLSSVNDAAYYAYIPAKFDGLISVYRPRTSFFRHNAITCGWDTVSDKLAIYEISSRPRGMLVEPFVKELSSRLQKSLNDVKSRPASSSQTSFKTKIVP